MMWRTRKMPRAKRADGEIVVSLSEMNQEINLEKYLGREPTETEKQRFADLAIDTITTRTLDGKTINGGKFAKYSKAYADKKGVTQDSVDLFLDGDMLGSIRRRVEGEKQNTLMIALQEDQVPKGYNHNVGDTVKKRPWFGLTDLEAKAIANRINSSREPRQLTLSELRERLSRLGIQQTE